MVAGHFVTLATFLVQPNPQAPVLHENVVHPHSQRRADAGERIDHQPNHRPVAQSRWRRHIDLIEQSPRLVWREHRRLAAPDAVSWSTHRRGRVGRHDLACDQPIKQVVHTSKPLFDGWHAHRGTELFNPCCNVEGLHAWD